MRPCLTMNVAHQISTIMIIKDFLQSSYKIEHKNTCTLISFVNSAPVAPPINYYQKKQVTVYGVAYKAGIIMVIDEWVRTSIKNIYTL